MSERDRTRREQLTGAFWRRHANPWSGWSRFLAGPLLMYAIYARKRRMLVGLLAFTVINPVLFPPPKSTDNWMSRGVEAERFWLTNGPRWSLTNLLNAVNVPISLFALFSAIRRRPLGTVLGTIGMMSLKMAFIQRAIEFHDASRD